MGLPPPGANDIRVLESLMLVCGGADRQENGQINGKASGGLCYSEMVYIFCRFQAHAF